MLLAVFGISGGTLGLLVNLLVLFLIVTWLALIYWTYLDARRRIDDPFLVTCATAASSFFPFVGAVVYTILRPPEFLDDVEERDLEIRAAELRVRQLIEQSCPHCEYPIERNYLRCPNCERKVKGPCRKCRKPLDPKWAICPYCETQVPRRQTEESGRRRAPDRGQRPGREPQVAVRGGAGGQRQPGQPSGQRSARPQDGPRQGPPGGPAPRPGGSHPGTTTS